MQALAPELKNSILELSKVHTLAEVSRLSGVAYESVYSCVRHAREKLKRYKSRARSQNPLASLNGITTAEEQVKVGEAIRKSFVKPEARIVSPTKFSSSVADWNAKLEQAIEECADCLRRGESIEWSKYGFGVKTSTISKRASAIVNAEQEAAALLGPAFQMSRSSAYQYLMFLCLLLGLLSSKPLVAFREPVNSASYQRIPE